LRLRTRGRPVLTRYRALKLGLAMLCVPWLGCVRAGQISLYGRPHPRRSGLVRTHKTKLQLETKGRCGAAVRRLEGMDPWGRAIDQRMPQQGVRKKGDKCKFGAHGIRVMIEKVSNGLEPLDRMTNPLRVGFLLYAWQEELRGAKNRTADHLVATWSSNEKACYVLDSRLFGIHKDCLVAWDGIEPPTQGFSILCSTD